jgi:5-methylcytosine-specific restriction endonuclease McrA
MAKCEICGREFDKIRGLFSHVYQAHKISSEEYYLKYIGIKGNCKVCGKDTKFISVEKGYQIYCSIQCLSGDPDIIKKRENTYYEKTGYKNPLQNPVIIEKRENTYYEKTGYKNPGQNPEVQEKRENTYYEKTGYSYPYQNPVVQKKKEDDYYEKTGYKHHLQNQDVIKKRKIRCFEKTGYIHPMQNPEVQEKRENTYFEKTGYIHPMQNPEVQERSKNTYFKKTGYEHPGQNPEVAKKIGEGNRLNFKKVLKRFPYLVSIENLIEGPNGEVLAHCKNANCPNSIENGGRFEVTSYQIQFRNQGINSTSDGHYLYCCEECKKECILYGKSATTLNNIFSPPDELSKASQSDLYIWRNEVFTRQLKDNKDHLENFCEICHKTENLVGHHIQPQKLYPEFSIDPDNGIVLCSECHKKYGHKIGTECSTGYLANKVCK